MANVNMSFTGLFKFLLKYCSVLMTSTTSAVSKGRSCVLCVKWRRHDSKDSIDIVANEFLNVNFSI